MDRGHFKSARSDKTVGSDLDDPDSYRIVVAGASMNLVSSASGGYLGGLEKVVFGDRHRDLDLTVG